jgi:hypothetical protein
MATMVAWLLSRDAGGEAGWSKLQARLTARHNPNPKYNLWFFILRSFVLCHYRSEFALLAQIFNAKTPRRKKE